MTTPRIEPESAHASFAALDFETANFDADSACALGITIVEDGRVRESRSWLIDPRTRWWVFTTFHGIAPEDVAGAPSFGELWPEVEPLLRGRILAAHNAHFDLRVMRACFARYGIEASADAALCTVRLAKKALRFDRAPLDRVCGALGIPLKHHDAASDASACAAIVLRAAEAVGWEESLRIGQIRRRIGKR